MKRPVRILAALAALIAAPIVAFALTVNDAAPDFSGQDLQGKAVKLSDYKGKYVVLEWVNPGCPFVVRHYSSGNMQSLQKSVTGQGAVWLTINSTNPSHGDFKSPEQMNQWMSDHKAAATATLLDKDGKIGKAYGAKATPHMFIIDPQGKLIYNGAIDDKRSANAKDNETAHNFVKAAFEEAKAGKAISNASNNPYGCGIKY